MRKIHEPPTDTVILNSALVRKKINSSNNVAKQSSILALGTLVSRISGQFRSIALVAALGATGIAANAFDIANNIPNTMLVIISGGILNSILVPQIIKSKQFKNSQDRLNKLLTLFGIIILTLTLLLTLTAPLIIRLFAGVNWTDQQINLAIILAYFCMPQVFFYGLYTILGQVAQAENRFATFGWAPVANNIISVIGFSIFIFYTYHIYKIDSINNLEQWNSPMILLLCLTATLGIAIQAILMFIPLKKAHFKFKFSLGLKGIGLREISNISFWSFMIVLLEEIVALVFIKIASDAPVASGVTDTASIIGNAAYTQAVTIYIVPYSLVAVSVATALFTKMAKAAAENSHQTIAKLLIKSIKTISVFMVFAWILIALEAPHIVEVLIPSASYYSFEAISNLLIYFSFILIPISNILLMKRVFFANSNAKKVFIYSIPYAVVALILVTSFSLTTTPANWTILIVISAALAYWIDLIFFTKGIKKELGLYFSYPSLLGFSIKIIIVSLPTILVGLLTKHILGWTYFTSWWTAVWQLFIIGGFMLITYVFMLKIMAVEQRSFYIQPMIITYKKAIIYLKKLRRIKK
ncbi:MAG: hypothetical protein LBT99_01940 [Bifidobacteriaceae bacterium]|jgi:putative peptidoglycan lipid II flippase|nr:hypothetical protein [Bifidobacteriaceae bacterium]